MVACDKICYDEYKDAKSHIAGMIKRKGGSGYKVYKCDKCGKFHVTTLPKRNQKLKPLKEKNYKPEAKNFPTIETIHCKIKKNKKGNQQSIVTTYKPFEYIFKQ